MKDAIAGAYQSRREELLEQVSQLKSREIWLSRSRGVVFLASLACAFLGWAGAVGAVAWYGLAAILFLGFLAVVGIHDTMASQRTMLQLRAELQRQQCARYERQWEQVPVPTVDVAREYRAVAEDLDLFGLGSIYHWLCRARTTGGMARMRDWLLAPCHIHRLPERQAAVQALARNRELRDKLELHARLLADSDAGPEDLIAWAESPRWYAPRTALRWTIKLLTLLMILLPLLILARVLSPAWALVVLGQVALHVIINAVYVGGVHDLFNRITAGKDELVHSTCLFEIVDQLPAEPALLGQLQHQMAVGTRDFRPVLAELQWIMMLAGGRRSSVWGVPYVVVQILYFWDFHVLEWLERWQLRNGRSIRHWYDAVYDLEALCSLATVAADHPHWTLPTVDPTFTHWEAVALGHPLLLPDACRRNDVRLGPSGTFLLVTGSNMSGKSTLLRSIGVNTVLAQSGGYVCAERLSLPPVRLATSMRVTDSLTEGVSFFFAELKRLKSIVDDARQADLVEHRRQLFLLDEILQGTNSAERHIAVARVIKFLVAQQTLGAVSTHDLELARSPELSTRCQTVHFRERFETVAGERKMTFDYVLREGVSPTTNALKLLELVGLTD